MPYRCHVLRATEYAYMMAHDSSTVKIAMENDLAHITVRLCAMICAR
jgi:hypothetical protein